MPDARCAGAQLRRDPCLESPACTLRLTISVRLSSVSKCTSNARQGNAQCAGKACLPAPAQNSTILPRIRPESIKTILALYALRCMMIMYAGPEAEPAAVCRRMRIQPALESLPGQSAHAQQQHRSSPAEDGGQRLTALSMPGAAESAAPAAEPRRASRSALGDAQQEHASPDQSPGSPAVQQASCQLLGPLQALHPGACAESGTGKDVPQQPLTGPCSPALAPASPRGPGGSSADASASAQPEQPGSRQPQQADAPALPSPEAASLPQASPAPASAGPALPAQPEHCRDRPQSLAAKAGAVPESQVQPVPVDHQEPESSSSPASSSACEDVCTQQAGSEQALQVGTASSCSSGRSVAAPAQGLPAAAPHSTCSPGLQPACRASWSSEEWSDDDDSAGDSLGQPFFMVPDACCKGLKQSHCSGT